MMCKALTAENNSRRSRQRLTFVVQGVTVVVHVRLIVALDSITGVQVLGDHAEIGQVIRAIAAVRRETEQITVRLVAVVAVHAALASCACVNVSPFPSFCTNRVVSVCLASIGVKPLRFHAHIRYIGRMSFNH